MEYMWQIAQPITDIWVKSTVYLKFPSRIIRFIKMNINNRIAQLIFVPATTTPTHHSVNNQINEIDNDILLIMRHDPLL